MLFKAYFLKAGLHNIIVALKQCVLLRTAPQLLDLMVLCDCASYIIHKVSLEVNMSFKETRGVVE